MSAPWHFDRREPSTAAQSIREQDVLEAANALAEGVLTEEANTCLACDGKKDCNECPWKRIGELAQRYQDERDGKREVK